MASTSSKTDDGDWSGPRISHAAFARELAARRAALGNPVLPRNDGTRRSDSKRALLAAIAAAGGNW